MRVATNNSRVRTANASSRRLGATEQATVVTTAMNSTVPTVAVSSRSVPTDCVYVIDEAIIKRARVAMTSFLARAATNVDHSR